MEINIYTPTTDRTLLLAFDRELAARIHARLEGAYDEARKLVGTQREAVTYLASMIPFGRPLEGKALARTVKCARAKLVS